ncbi:unnamed protein product, partial [Meganyctiphanes norvegica]
GAMVCSVRWRCGLEMRGLILWCLLGLALVARAEEEQIIKTAEDSDLLETLDEDARIDVARMLSDLFDFSDEADAVHNEELGINREARAKNEEVVGEEKAMAIEPEDQSRYNKFIDTFFRRLNADARSSIDPMDVSITPSKARKGATKGGAKKGKKEGDKKSGNKKDNKKKQKKGNNKNKKNKKKTVKTGRNPKILNLDEAEDEIAEVVDTVAEEEEHHIVAREAIGVEEIEEEDEDEEEVLEREERSADPEDEESADDSEVAANRSGKPKNGKKNKNKKNRGKGNNKKKNKNKNKNNNNKKSKRSTDKKGKSNKGKSNKGKSDKGAKTSRASVSGIASLGRVGDVSVVNRKDGKELRTDFKIGPVNLKVNRRFGSGKSAEVRSATATSPELTGRMHLAVAANGKATITKFTIAKPSVVTTSGSLNRDQNKRGARNNFMEVSIGRATPFAAKKLKLAARAVLQATESKN